MRRTRMPTAKAVKHAALALAAVAACGVALGSAGVASAEQTAQETIDQLEQQGYTVTLDKMGSAPISQCTVTSVRNPQTMTQWVPYVGPVLGGRDSGNILVPVVTSQSISVSLDCTSR